MSEPKNPLYLIYFGCSIIFLLHLSPLRLLPCVASDSNPIYIKSWNYRMDCFRILIGYVGGQLIYAPLANQFGRLKALRTGLTINLVGICICLFAISQENYWILVSGRLITALGSASGLACTFILINEWLPESQRKTAMAYSVLSFALGIGFAVVIGGIITEYLHWQWCFWFLLAHGIIMLLGTSVFSETLVHPKPIRIITIIRDYYAALASEQLVIFL